MNQPRRLGELLPDVIADLAQRHGITPPTTLTDRSTTLTTPQPGTFTWEEPPATAFPRRFHSKWAEVAAQLRANPGQWAKLDVSDVKSPKTFAYTVKNGTTKAWRPQGAFEAVCTPDRDVYVRYVGDTQDGAA